MAYFVVREIDRADPAVMAGLRGAGVATVHEAAGRTGLLGPAIRPLQTGARIAGPAVTVSCHPGDNLMVHAGVEQVAPGDVLVITTTSLSTDAMVGELIATSLAQRGCAGVVVDAGIRDAADLREMGFPVWSRAVHAQGALKSAPGSVNLTVCCAGQIVHPGDVVVADDDGVCAVGRAAAKSVLKACQARIEREARTREVLKAGTLGLDHNNLRSVLERLGVRYVRRAEDIPSAS
jgi:4-hydroxy-4-methyl-2-oxoglutarate aldolase